MPNLGLPPARLEIVKIITFLIKKLPNPGLPPAKLEIVKIITFFNKEIAKFWSGWGGAHLESPTTKNCYVETCRRKMNKNCSTRPPYERKTW